MNDAFAGVTEDEGVVVRSADVDGMTLAELWFPPDYVQEEVVPELPYLALVIDGVLEKSFRLRTMHLNKACALTMPADLAHAARFGPTGARIVIVKPKKEPKQLGGSLDRLAQLSVPGMTWLAWRLAGELRAGDTAAPLAAAGFALELLAATSRASVFARRSRRPPAWLRSAEELLRACHGECIGLGEVADATCLNVYDGNRAKIGGLVKVSSDPTLPAGVFAWFSVFDNGEGADAAPDRSSLVGFGDEAANEAFCNSPNLPRFGPWDVQGNVQVHG